MSNSNQLPHFNNSSSNSNKSNKVDPTALSNLDKAAGGGARGGIGEDKASGRYDQDGKEIKPASGTPPPPTIRPSSLPPEDHKVPLKIVRQLEFQCAGWDGFLEAAMSQKDFHEAVSERDAAASGGDRDAEEEDSHSLRMKNPIGFTRAMDYFTANFAEHHLKKNAKDSKKGSQTLNTGGYIYEDDELDLLDQVLPAASGVLRITLGCAAIVHSSSQVPSVSSSTLQQEKNGGGGSEDEESAFFPIPPYEEPTEGDASPSESAVSPSSNAPTKAEEEGKVQEEGLELEIFPSINPLSTMIQIRWMRVRSVLLKSNSEVAERAKSLFLSMWKRFSLVQEAHTVKKWPNDLMVPAHDHNSRYSSSKRSIWKEPARYTQMIADHHYAPWLLNLLYPIQHALNSKTPQEMDRKLALIGQLPAVERIQEIRATLLKYFESSKVMAELKATSGGGQSDGEGKATTPPPPFSFKPAYEECGPGKYAAIPLSWLDNWRIAHCPDEELSDDLLTRKKNRAAKSAAAAASSSPGPSPAAKSNNSGVEDPASKQQPFVQKIHTWSPFDLTEIYSATSVFDSASPRLQNEYKAKLLAFVPLDVAETFIFAYGGGPLVTHPFFLDATTGLACPAMEKVKIGVSVELPKSGVVEFKFEEYKKPMTAKQVLFDLCYPELFPEAQAEVNEMLKNNKLLFESVSSLYGDEPLDWDEKVEWSASTTGSKFKVGRCLEPGETKYERGHCGLQNMGNTCFMNAAMQCLSNCEPLRHKLIGAQGGFSSTVTPDQELTSSSVINEEKTPLLFQFTKLLKLMWSGQRSSVRPTKFREAFVKRHAQFNNREQHDSVEFLTAALDDMHEELNPVKSRAYRQREDSDMEKYTQDELQQLFWNDYLKNNNTMFTPLFHGQMKTLMTCVQCQSSRVVFDGFSTIPLSIDKMHKHTYDLHVYDIERNTKHMVRVRVPLDSPIAVIKTDLLKMDFLKGHVPEEIEILKWHHSQYAREKPTQSFTNNSDKTLANDTYEVWLSTARMRHALPLPPTPEPEEEEDNDGTKEEEGDASPAEAAKKKKKKAKKEKEPKYLPFCRAVVNIYATGDGDREYQDVVFFPPECDIVKFHEFLWSHFKHNITISTADGTDPAAASDEELYDAFLKNINFRLKLFHNDYYRGRTETWEKRPFDKYKDLAMIDKPHEFDDRLYSECKMFFSQNEDQPGNIKMQFKPMNIVNDKSLQEVPDNEKVSKDCTLEKAFERSSNTHLVDDDVYCPKCKVPQQTLQENRAAVLPEVLIVQFKRFQFSMQTFSMRKIVTDVDFPVELDMSPYVTEECRMRENCTYSLSGVILHSGTLTGGHYTATAWDSEGEKAPWVHYDDSRASTVDHAPHGGERSYIMFYQRVDPSKSPRVAGSKTKARQMTKAERAESFQAPSSQEGSHQPQTQEGVPPDTDGDAAFAAALATQGSDIIDDSML